MSERAQERESKLQGARPQKSSPGGINRGSGMRENQEERCHASQDWRQRFLNCRRGNRLRTLHCAVRSGGRGAVEGRLQ